MTVDAAVQGTSEPELIELRVDDLGQRFTASRARGVESLSGTYRFEVDLLTARRLPPDGDSLVGHSATLRFTDRDGTRRRVRGVIEAQRIFGHPLSGDRLQYRVTLVPRLALLRRRRNSRIFQDRSALEIVGMVLNRGRVQVRSEVEATLPRMEYCVQYRESDLGFVERLLAEHGIAYWFEHPDDPPEEDPSAADATLPGMAGYTVEGLRAVTGDGLARRVVSEVMVLCDAPSRFPRLDAPPGREDLATPKGRKLLFGARLDASSETASDVTDFEWRSAARTTAVQQVGYDPLHPTSRPEARAQRFDPTKEDSMSVVDRLGMEVFLHRDEYSRSSVERRGARVELERRQRRASEGEGKSRCTALFAGARVVLDGHPVEALNRPYLVTRVVHEARAPELALEDIGRGVRSPTYSNTFQCVPGDRAWRPKPPARKVQQVMETATVVGPPGETVHTDNLGRVRVRFHWDRADGSRGDSSCWVRVSQPWAGDGHGAVFLPRVGSEVVVAFLDGDTDRPVIVGGLYNGAHAPPWSLPDERTRQGIRGRSVGGPAGSERHNEIVFEDRHGAEKLGLHAARDLSLSSANDRRSEVRGDDGLTVSGRRRVEVAGELDERVAGDARREHGRDLHEAVLGSRYDKVEGDSVSSVRGARRERVSGALSTRVEGEATLTFDRDRTDRVAGNLVVQTGDVTSPRSLVLHAHDRVSIGATDAIELRAERELVLRCGTSLVRLTPDRVEVVGKEVVLTGEDARVTLSEGVARVRAKKEGHLVAEKVLVRSPQGGAVGVGGDVEVLGGEVRVDAPSAGTGLTIDPTPPATKFELRDQNGEPIAFARFELTLDDGSSLSGVLDHDGRAEMELDQGGTVRFVEHPGARRG